MTTLGRFTAVDGGYVGRLTTLTLDREMRLTPSGVEGDKTPSHRLFAGEVECGAAWPVEGEGAVLSVKLDDPSWPEPVRARLVHGAGEDFLLVWRRPARE